LTIPFSLGLVGIVASERKKTENYEFPCRPLAQSYLSAETNLPLVCCGDWCGGNFIEGAMHSGIAAAVEIHRQMEGRSLPGANFLMAFAL